MGHSHETQLKVTWRGLSKDRNWARNKLSTLETAVWHPMMPNKYSRRCAPWSNNLIPLRGFIYLPPLGSYVHCFSVGILILLPHGVMRIAFPSGFYLFIYSLWDHMHCILYRAPNLLVLRGHAHCIPFRVSFIYLPRLRSYALYSL